MGLGELSPWHLLILAAVVLVLFGAKRLPDSARSLGRAMRIFKAETPGCTTVTKTDDGSAQATQSQLPRARPPRASLLSPPRRHSCLQRHPPRTTAPW